MTNEELLQQAKDQVAQNHGWKFENWDALEKHYRSEGDSAGYIAYLEIAAKMAIQRAREEGIYTDFNYDIVAANIMDEPPLLTEEEAEPALSKEEFFQLIGASWDHADANVIWDTLEHSKYKIQKLTAPGR